MALAEGGSAPIPPPMARAHPAAPRRTSQVIAEAVPPFRKASSAGDDRLASPSRCPRAEDSEEKVQPVEKAPKKMDAAEEDGPAIVIPEIDPKELAIKDEILEMGCPGQVETFLGELKGQQVIVKKFVKFGKLNLREQVQFTREITHLASLNHPKLIKLLGVSLSTMPPQMVLEHCAGGTLYEMLHNSFDVELAWWQIVQMSQDIAETVAYLHSKKFIHRDLTSLNLMLEQVLKDDKDIPIVKVCDLCSARLRDSSEGWANMTKDVGTLVWSAPEILSRVPTYDEKVDVYSFAMILFEMVCREPPFEDMDTIEIVRTVSAGGRPSLESLPLDCPPGLRDLITSSWAQSPSDRLSFARICAVLGDLRTCLL